MYGLAYITLRYVRFVLYCTARTTHVLSEHKQHCGRVHHLLETTTQQQRQDNETFPSAILKLRVGRGTKKSPAGRRGISSLASTSSPVIWRKKAFASPPQPTQPPTPLSPTAARLGRKLGEETDGALWSRMGDATMGPRDLRSFCFYGVAVSGQWERCPVLSISGLMGGG
jgi:hypothetical protein